MAHDTLGPSQVHVVLLPLHTPPPGHSCNSTSPQLEAPVRVDALLNKTNPASANQNMKQKHKHTIGLRCVNQPESAVTECTIHKRFVGKGPATCRSDGFLQLLSFSDILISISKAKLGTQEDFYQSLLHKKY